MLGEGTPSDQGFYSHNREGVHSEPITETMVFDQERYCPNVQASNHSFCCQECVCRNRETWEKADVWGFRAHGRHFASQKDSPVVSCCQFWVRIVLDQARCHAFRL
jgi:hypothetical protein